VTSCRTSPDSAAGSSHRRGHWFDPSTAYVNISRPIRCVTSWLTVCGQRTRR
jgi:hypothetical protein